jgi:hypothetical protein
VSWKSIKSMPKDELIILGTWVNHTGVKDAQPEYYIAYYCSEDNSFYDQSWEASLPFDEIEDYDFWMKIPKMKTNEPAKLANIYDQAPK